MAGNDIAPTPRILTLCPQCSQLLETNFKLSKVKTATTTQKKAACEQCRRKFPADVLTQYTITARGTRR